MLNYLKQIWNTHDLRNKILYTLGILIIYRVMIQISIPGINMANLKTLFDSQAGGALGAFSVLTGGSAENFSIVLMGLSPYINASIIIQLLTVISPRLEAISKEGELGRARINRFTTILTVPLAFLQSYGMLILLNTSAGQLPIISDIKDPFTVIPIMIVVTAGTMALVWLGNLITENGIGNGSSLLIMTSILSGIAPQLGSALKLASENTDKLVPIAAIGIATALLTILIVIISESHRNIPISYGGRGQSLKQNFFPIRLNQAGMIPIMFAVSLIAFPGVLAQFLKTSTSTKLQEVADFLSANFNQTGPLYMILYFLLIIVFTYFYVSITFNPDQIADNIQKRGGFVPGIRPGKQTAEYLSKASNRLTLFGGLFIGFVAVAPMIADAIFSQTSSGAVPVLVGGSGLIIIVGVILDLMRQISAQLSMHNYDKFY